MENIISLLQDKNQHLQRFHDMNKSELVNFVAGNFDNLEGFYESREALLDLIKCMDRLIDKVPVTPAEAAAISDSHRNQIKRCLAEKNELVQKILAQDLQILSVLETTKSNIIKELTQVKAARKAVGAYHSGGQDVRLDEEA